MYPGMWTSILVELSPTDAIGRIADIGWPGIELSTEHICAIADSASPERECEAVRALVEKRGLHMPQVHVMIGANVASADEARREADTATVMRHVELSALMGITTGVIHPGGDNPMTLEEFQAEKIRRVEGFKRLAEHAAGHGVSLAIENMSDAGRASRGARGMRRYGSLISELHELIDDIAMPNVGICYDTGHGNLQGLTMADAVRQCGERLIATHITDNDGSGDQHRTPFYGNVDWHEGIAAMREICYDGMFNLEVPGERGLPTKQLDYRLEYALQITNWLLGA